MMKKKKDIMPLNDKGQRHGYHKVYYDNGEIMHEGEWVNNNASGLWVLYWNTDHSLSIKTFYIR
jgi:antitoxin component YwqK of YwqJK toxin-antitoxin module